MIKSPIEPILGVFLFLLTLLSGQAGALTQDEANNIEVYRKAAPAVVNITSVVVKRDVFYRPVPQEGMGSGVIISKEGYVLTNTHVVQNAAALEVTLADGSKWPASLVGGDPDNDLAVLKIGTPGDKLVQISMGSSTSLEVGDKVLAIGNPFGLGQTLTKGVVGSLGRDIRAVTGSVIRNMIQTDAAVNPGNSGGPLLNSRGELIGINTVIVSPTGASAGIGFAVPVDTIKQIAPRLISMKASYYGIRPILFFGVIFFGFYLFWRGLIRRQQDRNGKRDHGGATFEK